MDKKYKGNKAFDFVKLIEVAKETDVNLNPTKNRWNFAEYTKTTMKKRCISAYKFVQLSLST